MTWTRGIRRGWLLVMAASAALLLAACSSAIPQPPPEPAAAPAEGTQPVQPAPRNTPAPPPQTSGGPSDDRGDGQVGQEGGRFQPLAIEQRHPTGVTLTVTGLRVAGDDVLVDAEIVNGSRTKATFHRGNYSPLRLRLVDASGNEYNFVETEDRGLVLDPGERLGGRLAFRGPLQADTGLRLVTNIRTDRIDGFDITTEPNGLLSSMFPQFVVPLA